MKAAKNLYKKEDEQITRYEKRELMIMLANRLYHSPEISEEDEEDPSKTIICIYDYSWRSNEVCDLFLYFHVRFILFCNFFFF